MDCRFLGAFGGRGRGVPGCTANEPGDRAVESGAVRQLILGSRKLGIPGPRVSLAAWVLASVSVQLDLGHCSVHLDSTRVCLHTGVLGLQPGQSRISVCAGVFSQSDLRARGIPLEAHLLDRVRRAVDASLRPTPISSPLFRRLLCAAVPPAPVHSLFRLPCAAPGLCLAVRVL